MNDRAGFGSLIRLRSGQSVPVEVMELVDPSENPRVPEQTEVAAALDGQTLELPGMRWHISVGPKVFVRWLGASEQLRGELVMAMPSLWILPLVFVTLLDAPAGPGGTAQSRPQEVRNSIGMRLVEIPGGSFDMGSTVGPGEAPVHRVSVKSFWMGVTEVTQAQWQTIMGDNPSHFKKAGLDAPVEMVNWDDAQAFVRKLNEREPGWRYRLPSEAEWEYACLAGTAKDPYGPPEAVAWIKENSGGTTHPVGLKVPNAFGLHDMFGNVPEWTQDTWHADYKGAPTDGSAWGGGGSPHHTLRGGGWDLPAFFLHAALRGPYGEIHRRGFRVAADRR